MRETEVQQPNTTATCSFCSNSRAFSANKGQSDAGSTTTGSSLRPNKPPFSLISSIVINATSFSDVSLMAMVPDRECRMPTLIGPSSFFSAAATGVAATATLVAVSSSLPLPLQPSIRTRRDNDNNNNFHDFMPNTSLSVHERRCSRADVCREHAHRFGKLDGAGAV